MLMVNFSRIMIKIDFSQEEIDLLDWERKHHPHPRVRQKMEVLYFKAMGLPHARSKGFAKSPAPPWSGICANTRKAAWASCANSASASPKAR